MSTYSVVVALHIIAAFAAYGLPLAYPLLLPYLRRHHPAALPGVHAIQYRLNRVPHRPVHGAAARASASTWRATAATGSEPFVAIGVGAIAIIAVVGGGVIVPATKRLAGLEPAVRRVRARLPRAT